MTDLPQWNLYLAFVFRSRCVTLCTTLQLDMPALTLLQHATLSLQEFTPDICLLGSFSVQISHIEIPHLYSAFLQHKSHIFFGANLTFLLCKSHISPVQMSHFSSANLTFLQFKSHISPAQISHFSCVISHSYRGRSSSPGNINWVGFCPKRTKVACANWVHFSLWASMAVCMTTSTICYLTAYHKLLASNLL